MKKIFINIFAIFITAIIFIGCGAPKQIKQLSVKQTGYFTTAVQAVEAQSEALIAASEKVKIEAQKKIDQIEKDNRLRFQKLASETIPKLPDHQKERTIRRMVEEIEKIANEARDKKEKIEADFKSIVSQTAHFTTYMQKMKQIQQVLDAYMQSETAYDNLMKRVFNYSSHDQLISDTEKLKPE